MLVHLSILHAWALIPKPSTLASTWAAEHGWVLLVRLLFGSFWHVLQVCPSWILIPQPSTPAYVRARVEGRGEPACMGDAEVKFRVLNPIPYPLNHKTYTPKNVQPGT